MMLTLRFGLIALIQAGLLFSMVYERASILRDGTSVFLKTAPIDPRSLFRGYYVDLNYDISRLNPTSLEGDNDFVRHQEIYVALEKHGDFWVASGLYHTPSIALGDQVALKGVVQWVTSKNGTPKTITSLSIDYGIESYFVPEHDGKKIEAELRKPNSADQVRMEIAIDADGRGVIKGFYMDQELLYKEKRF